MSDNEYNVIQDIQPQKAPEEKQEPLAMVEKEPIQTKTISHIEWMSDVKYADGPNGHGLFKQSERDSAVSQYKSKRADVEAEQTRAQRTLNLNAAEEILDAFLTTGEHLKLEQIQDYRNKGVSWKVLEPSLKYIRALEKATNTQHEKDEQVELERLDAQNKLEQELFDVGMGAGPIQQKEAAHLLTLERSVIESGWGIADTEDLKEERETSLEALYKDAGVTGDPTEKIKFLNQYIKDKNIKIKIDEKALAKALAEAQKEDADVTRNDLAVLTQHYKMGDHNMTTADGTTKSFNALERWRMPPVQEAFKKIDEILSSVNTATAARKMLEEQFGYYEYGSEKAGFDKSNSVIQESDGSWRLAEAGETEDASAIFSLSDAVNIRGRLEDKETAEVTAAITVNNEATTAVELAFYNRSQEDRLEGEEAHRTFANRFQNSAIPDDNLREYLEDNRAVIGEKDFLKYWRAIKDRGTQSNLSSGIWPHITKVRDYFNTITGDLGDIVGMTGLKPDQWVGSRYVANLKDSDGNLYFDVERTDDGKVMLTAKEMLEMEAHIDSERNKVLNTIDAMSAQGKNPIEIAGVVDKFIGSELAMKVLSPGAKVFTPPKEIIEKGRFFSAAVTAEGLGKEQFKEGQLSWSEQFERELFVDLEASPETKGKLSRKQIQQGLEGASFMKKDQGPYSPSGYETADAGPGTMTLDEVLEDIRGVPATFPVRMEVEATKEITRFLRPEWEGGYSSVPLVESEVYEEAAIDAEKKGIATSVSVQVDPDRQFNDMTTKQILAQVDFINTIKDADGERRGPTIAELTNIGGMKAEEAGSLDDRMVFRLSQVFSLKNDEKGNYIPNKPLINVKGKGGVHVDGFVRASKLATGEVVYTIFDPEQMVYYWTSGSGLASSLPINSRRVQWIQYKPSWVRK